MDSPAETMLQALREELDAMDHRLLAIVRDRLECCCRIGHHKRVHGVPMMQPARIGVVQQRAADFARTNGLSPDFLRRLYELIIAETCRLEDEIIATDAPAIPGPAASSSSSSS
jgi:chorismate mutase